MRPKDHSSTSAASSDVEHEASSLDHGELVRSLSLESGTNTRELKSQRKKSAMSAKTLPLAPSPSSRRVAAATSQMAMGGVSAPASHNSRTKRVQGRFEVVDLESRDSGGATSGNASGAERPEGASSASPSPKSSKSRSRRNSPPSRDAIMSAVTVAPSTTTTAMNVPKLRIAGRFQVQDLDAKSAASTGALSNALSGNSKALSPSIDVVAATGAASCHHTSDADAVAQGNLSDDARSTTKVAGRFEVCDIVAVNDSKVQPSSARSSACTEASSSSDSTPTISARDSTNHDRNSVLFRELREASTADFLAALAHKLKTIEAENCELRRQNERLERTVESLRRQRHG